MSKSFEQKAKKENVIADLTGKAYYSDSTKPFILSYLKKKKRLTPLESFIMSNLKLVSIISQRFVTSRLSRDELMSAGIEALIKCFNTYDSGKGVVSGAYVQQAIRWGIRVYAMKNKCALSVPSNPAKCLSYQLTCDPVNTIAIDALEDDDSSAFVPAVDNKIFDFSDARAVRKAVSRLCPEERTVIEMHYFQGKSFPEIDKALDRFGAANYRAVVARKKLREYYNKKNITVEF